MTDVVDTQKSHYHPTALLASRYYNNVQKKRSVELPSCATETPVVKAQQIYALLSPGISRAALPCSIADISAADSPSFCRFLFWSVGKYG